MIILGIDPGTARTGWGIIKSQKSTLRLRSRLMVSKAEPSKVKSQKFELIKYGCVVTDKSDGAGKRLLILRRELKKIINDHKPEIMAVERLFFGINAKTAISVGQATGVIILTASEHKLPIVEYTGLQVKLTVAGHGRADKKLVQRKIRQILGVNRRTTSFSTKDHSWDDAADALAIAIHHALKIF